MTVGELRYILGQYADDTEVTVSYPGRDLAMHNDGRIYDISEDLDKDDNLYVIIEWVS